jgi:hypothetical protein
MIRIEVTREGHYLNHTTARFNRVPHIANYLATTGKVKEAYESFKADKLSEIKAAYDQLSVWVTGL